MSNQPDLFEEPSSRRRAAPADLTPAEWSSLRAWAEERVPWVLRGALGAERSLEVYVETVLDWGRAKGVRRPGWVATIRNWIRNDEYPRLSRLAARGDASARLALRDAKAWRTEYDRAHAQVVALEQLSPSGPELVRPLGGTVTRLRRGD